MEKFSGRKERSKVGGGGVWKKEIVETEEVQARCKPKVHFINGRISAHMNLGTFQQIWEGAQKSVLLIN